MSLLTSSSYEPGKVEQLYSPKQGFAVTKKGISVGDMRSKSIESNVASVVGANCTSAVVSMIHLVAMKSIEGAVTGFLQNMLTSFEKVMRYSQIASADSVVSAHVHSHVARSHTRDSISQLSIQCAMSQSEHRQQIS